MNGRALRRDDAASDEIARLAGLPPAALASELLPVFGDVGTGSPEFRLVHVVRWLMADFPNPPDLCPLVSAVLGGLQWLERRALVEQSAPGSGAGGQRYRLTRSGQAVLDAERAGRELSVSGVG